MGRPGSSFIGEGKTRVTEEEKEKNEIEKNAYRVAVSFFSFSSAITRAFPWPIKGKVECPMKGIQIRTRSNHEIKAQEQ